MDFLVASCYKRMVVFFPMAGQVHTAPLFQVCTWHGPQAMINELSTCAYTKDALQLSYVCAWAL